MGVDVMVTHSVVARSFPRLFFLTVKGSGIFIGLVL